VAIPAVITSWLWRIAFREIIAPTTLDFSRDKSVHVLVNDCYDGRAIVPGKRPRAFLSDGAGLAGASLRRNT
jgi:hypothetical protein